MDCDEEICHPNTFAELWEKKVWLAGPADYSSKQNNRERGRQSDMGMVEPHSLLDIYASAEKQICDHDW